jgi:peptidyl-prolyl cis-trans isomerase SurA
MNPPVRAICGRPFPPSPRRPAPASLGARPCASAPLRPCGGTGHRLLAAGLGLALGACLLGAGARAEAAVLDRIAAVVNNDVITLSEVQEEALPQIQKITKDYVEPEQDAQLVTLYQKYLDQLIVRRLQIQEARKDQLIPSAAEINATIDDLKKKNGFRSDDELKRALATEGLSLSAFRRRVGEQLALSRITLKAVRNKIIIDEKEIQQFYQANQDKYRRTPEVTIRHILIGLPPEASETQVAEARAKAEAALAKLRAGADFAEVARAASDGPTAQSGGSLGTLHRGELAPELEEPAFTLTVGQVSDLIRTQSGFNIIKVEARMDEPMAPLEEVRDKIREALLDQKYDAKYKDWIEGLKRTASIQVRIHGDPDAVTKR